jgi:hypothetical protein
MHPSEAVILELGLRGNTRPLFPSCSSVARVVPPGMGIVLLSLNTTQLKRNTVAIVDPQSIDTRPAFFKRE